MSREYERRAAVIESFRAGHCAKDIIAWFNYPKTVVYDLKKAWEAADSKEDFTAQRKNHRKRSDSLRTGEFVSDVAEKVKADPGQSMATIAKAMNVSKSTIHRTVHDDLGMKSYAIRKRQLLTEDAKERRKLKALALIDELKHQSAGYFERMEMGTSSGKSASQRSFCLLMILSWMKFSSSLKKRSIPALCKCCFL